MKLFGSKHDPEQQARDAIRRKKWRKAIAFYESRLADHDRDYAKWNVLGDLHMHQRSRAQAVEAWRRALEGYALEGLHENVLGIARKLLRRMPEETDVHLVAAEAYLGLDYYADCFAEIRSYLKLAKHRSENDLRAILRKLLEAPIQHSHLLDELKILWEESGIEDIELQQQLEAYLAERQQIAAVHHPASAAENNASAAEFETPLAAQKPEQHTDGLLDLNAYESAGGGGELDSGEAPWRTAADFADRSTPFGENFDAPPRAEPASASSGEGKDHYDLGMVYKEMRLWDAAIQELEQARSDRGLRLRSSIALAECLQESHDLQRALAILDEARQSGDGNPDEVLGLRYRLGVIHELLGNIAQALEHFEAVHARNPAMGDVEARLKELRGQIDQSTADE